MLVFVCSRALRLSEHFADIWRVGHDGRPLLRCRWRALCVFCHHAQLAEIELSSHDALQAQHLTHHRRAP